MAEELPTEPRTLPLHYVALAALVSGVVGGAAMTLWVGVSIGALAISGLGPALLGDEAQVAPLFWLCSGGAIAWSVAWEEATRRVPRRWRLPVLLASSTLLPLLIAAVACWAIALWLGREHFEAWGLLIDWLSQEGSWGGVALAGLSAWTLVAAISGPRTGALPWHSAPLGLPARFAYAATGALLVLLLVSAYFDQWAGHGFRIFHYLALATGLVFGLWLSDLARDRWLSPAPQPEDPASPS